VKICGELTSELKARIDAMSQTEMARLWRFSPIGDPLFQGDTGAYFEARFKSLGFFTPAISKRIDGER
jgi:hypothetical protein